MKVTYASSLLCALSLIGASGFAVGQTVPTAPLWGKLEYNNNICGNNFCSRLFVDVPDQYELCMNEDQFERENPFWAQNADLHHCVVPNPLPDKLSCIWRCDYGTAGDGIVYYCGTWADMSPFGPETGPNGVDVCKVPTPNEKNPGPCPSVGNPCNPGYGNKYEEETDYAGEGSYPLRFSRTYNSKGVIQATAIGTRWRSNYDRALNPKIGIGASTVYAYRPDGKTLYFTLMKNGSAVSITPYDSAAAWQSDADIADRLTRVVDGSGNTLGWTYYVAATEETETYNAPGVLSTITNRAGAVQTFGYDGQGRLSSVTDPFGRQLSFSYNAQNQISSVTDPGGGVYQYTYDTVGNLASVTYPDLGVRQYLYNESQYTQNTNLPNALTGIIDEDANRFATFSYSTTGDVVSTQHAGGVDNYSVVYNYSNGTSAVTDPLGTTRTYSFTGILAVTKLTGISQPCPSCGGDSSATISYDANGNVASRTDFNNKQVCYAYDLTRNLETARLEGALSSESCSAVLASPPNRPDVRSITTTWNPTYRLPATITQPAAGGTKTTTFTYDGAGNLAKKSIIAPKNDGSGTNITRTWGWTYGTLGRMLTATDPDNNTTTYTYYSDTDPNLGERGQVQTITNAAGHITSITAYDANGQPLTIVDPNGLITTLAYDARGRLKSRQVGTEVTGYSYDAVGQLKLVTLPDSSTLQYTYDAAHRLTQVQDGLGNKIVYNPDAMGNHIGESAYDPSNNLARTRSRVYNALNQLYQDIGAQSQEVTTYTYDGNSNLKSASDPLTHQTTNTYDALNRLLTVLDPNGGTTGYTYDPANDLTQVTDPNGNVTSYTYDGLGDLIQQVSPDTGTTTNTYDAAGNLFTKTDAVGVVATYTYDALNRVAQAVYSKTNTPSETHQFTYDSGANAKGRLSQVTDPAATTAWTYNSQGRVGSKTQTVGSVVQSVGYGYNGAGQLTTVTTPSGQQIGYSYTNNRVSAITINGQSLITGAATEPFGPLAVWLWGNGLKMYRDYDTDGRLATWEFRNGTSIIEKDQRFDLASRIVGITDPINAPASQTYQYDVLDRLTVAQTGNPVTHTQQFSYDAVGNRQTVTLDGSVANLYYANSNRLQAFIGSVSSGYLNGATALTYTYNNANRLVAIQSSGTSVASYAVSALGQRISKTVGGMTTLFVYDEQGHLLGEYDGSGNLIQETVWLENLPVATLRPTGTTGNPIPINVYYVHADHLGTPRAVTRPSDNAIMWQWDNLDPFGANAANENPASQGVFHYNPRFPGQYYDAETGTHYNYSRDYDPTIGRYAKADALGLAGGMNIYQYVAAAPTAYIDPLGLKWWNGYVPPGCSPQVSWKNRFWENKNYEVLTWIPLAPYGLDPEVGVGGNPPPLESIPGLPGPLPPIAIEATLQFYMAVWEQIREITTHYWNQTEIVVMFCERRDPCGKTKFVRYELKYYDSGQYDDKPIYFWIEADIRLARWPIPSP